MEVKPGYKQTEVGVIPEDWRVEPLVNSVKLQGGYAFRSIAFCDIGVPVIRISDVQRGSVDVDGAVCHPEIAIPVEFLIQEGDALMAMSGATTGKVGVYRQKQFAYQNQRVGKFVIKDKKRTSSSFIIQLVRSDSFLKRLAVFLEQGAQPNISSSQVESLVLPFPPTLTEQEAIAEALSDADALIEALEQLIAKKRQIKQGAMQELLTGKQRLHGFANATTGYKQTEIGVIPDDWEVVSIGMLITEFRGGAPLKPSDFTQTGVKVLPKGGVGRTGWLRIEESELQYCSPAYAASHWRNQVDESFSIVVLRDLVPSGPSIGLIAQIRERETFVLAQGVYGFRVREATSVPSYLVHLSNTRWYRKMVNSIMVGSTQVHITNPAFKRAQIPLPSVPEQTAIAAILSDMDAEIAALEAKLAKARQLKQGMMQELLTGRIRLV